MQSDRSNPSGDRLDPGSLPSLDDQIKAAQRDKLQAEVRHLNGISMETAGKLVVTVLGIAAAAFTLYIGVPQTRLDLARAQEDLIQKKKDLDAKTAEAARQVALAGQKASEAQQRAAELADTELLRARSQDELARVQAEIVALGEELERRRQAAGKPREREVEQRIAQASKPRLFVQFAGDISRDHVIDPLRTELGGLGLIVPAAERINRGQNNEVRYFIKNDSESALAQKVADATQTYFKSQGCPLPALPIKYVSLPQGRQSPIELWLMHNCPG